jgi:hypothetical protein
MARVTVSSRWRIPWCVIDSVVTIVLKLVHCSSRLVACCVDKDSAGVVVCSQLVIPEKQLKQAKKDVRLRSDAGTHVSRIVCATLVNMNA